MTSQQQFIESVQHLACYGLKRSGRGFADDIITAWQALNPGLHVTAVRPDGSALEGFTTVRSAGEVEGQADAAVIVLNPARSHAAIDDAAAAGIRRLWLVMNSASRENTEHARQLGLEVTVGCPLLFMPHTGFPHNLHRGLARLFGRI
jgi:predicted CoA-binding protein